MKSIEEQNKESIKTNLELAIKRRDNTVIEFTNYQTLFLINLSVAAFYAEMLLPKMSGRGKQQIRTIINSFTSTVRIFKFENGFREETDEKLLDLEDKQSIVIRKWTRAVLEGKEDQFIDALKYHKTL